MSRFSEILNDKITDNRHGFYEVYITAQLDNSDAIESRDAIIEVRAALKQANASIVRFFRDESAFAAMISGPALEDLEKNESVRSISLFSEKPLSSDQGISEVPQPS